jgi:hypothetical protein
MKGLAFKKPKMTKRQRKAVRGLNEAMRNSLAKGKNVVVAGVTYIGETPSFFDRNAGYPGLPAEYVKVQPGIPFVRA